MRINNSNVKDHFLTECQFSNGEGFGRFKQATLTGFVEGRAYPFLTSIDAFKFARSIPKQTWGEALKEKLPSQVYDLVARYMGEEKLRMEFSSWNNLGLLYSFVNSKEGFTYHLNIVKFCNNDLDTCPLPPKPELRIMTTIELAGKYLIKKGDWWMVNIDNEDIKRYHNNGYKWADHPSSEQFSLMVEV